MPCSLYKIKTILLIAICITACGSTPEPTPSPTENTNGESCVEPEKKVCEPSDNTGKDRGFDPCDVNPKLPVCSTNG